MNYNMAERERRVFIIQVDLSCRGRPVYPRSHGQHDQHGTFDRIRS